MDKAGNCVYNTFHTADHSSAVFIGPASQVFCISPHRSPAEKFQTAKVQKVTSPTALPE